MNIVDRRTSTENRIGALLFALFYFFHAINSPVPGVKVGDLFLAASVAALLLTKGRDKIKLQGIHIHLFILFYLFCLLTLVDAIVHHYVDLGGIVVRIVRWAFYIFSACVVSQLISKRCLYRYVIALALFSAAVLILQVTVYTLARYPISFSVFGEKIGYSIESLRAAAFSNSIYRFSAFFSEPAHYAYFESLALVMLLFFNDQLGRRQFLTAGIIVFSMLLSTSTYALALLAVIALCFLFKHLRHGAGRRSGFLVALILASAIIVLYFLLQDTSLAAYAASKFRNIGTSSRTTFIWNSGIDFSVFDILFGCGAGNEEYYLLKQYGVQLGYLNSLSMAFLYGGVTGLVMTALYVLNAMARLGERGRVPFLILIVMSIFSTAFFSAVMVLFMVAATSVNEASPAAQRDRKDMVLELQ